MKSAPIKLLGFKCGSGDWRAGEDTRPYRTYRRRSGECRRGRRPRRPAGAQCAPLRLKRVALITKTVPLIRLAALGTFPQGKAFGRPQGSLLRRKTDRERWLGKLRRRPGTAPRINFVNPGPSGPAGIQTRTQILRAGIFLPTPRDNPRKWGPGKGDYEHEVLIWSRPRGRFAYFAAMGKVGRRPQAAKLPAKVSRCGPMRASGPTEVRKTKIAANPR